MSAVLRAQVDARHERAEAQLRARARMMIADEVIGTDLITDEISGQADDVILTREHALYLHNRLADLLGRRCASDRDDEPEGATHG